MGTRRNQGMTDDQLEEMINQRIAAALAQYAQNHNAGGGGGARGGAGPENIPRPCTYKAFMAGKPPTYTGREGAVGLLQWIEKIESTQSICGVDEADKVKFDVCTLSEGALTWWNSQVRLLSLEVAHRMSWTELKERMRKEYCPKNELQKLDREFWALKMEGSNITAYTRHFHELSILVPKYVTPESDGVDKYIMGLDPIIQGSVTSSKPATVQDAIEMANMLVDQAVLSGAMKATKEKYDQNEDGDNKRKRDDNEGSGSQQSNKRTDGTERKGYGGTNPRCNKCGYHHSGSCDSILCRNCKKPGHIAKNCRSANLGNNNDAAKNRNCYGCGGTGHFRKDCPKEQGT